MSRTKQVKNVQVVLIEKKLTDVDAMKAFLIGRRIKIVNNNHGHGYAIGSEYTVTADTPVNTNGTRTTVSFVMPEGYMGDRLDLRECIFTTETEETLKVELANVDSAINILTGDRYVIIEKLKFLEASKTTELDSDNFIKFKLESLLSSSKKKTNKVKEIMALLS